MKPIRLDSGVRSSWLTLATKSARMRSVCRSAGQVVQRDHQARLLGGARGRFPAPAPPDCAPPGREWRTRPLPARPPRAPRRRRPAGRGCAGRAPGRGHQRDPATPPPPGSGAHAPVLSDQDQRVRQGVQIPRSAPWCPAGRAAARAFAGGAGDGVAQPRRQQVAAGWRRRQLRRRRFRAMAEIAAEPCTRRKCWLSIAGISARTIETDGRDGRRRADPSRPAPRTAPSARPADSQHQRSQPAEAGARWRRAAGSPIALARRAKNSGMSLTAVRVLMSRSSRGPCPGARDVISQ